MKITIAPGSGCAALTHATGIIWKEVFSGVEVDALAEALDRLRRTVTPRDSALLKRLADLFSALNNDSAACIITTAGDLTDHRPERTEAFKPAEMLLVELLQAARNAAESCREHVPADDRGARDGETLFAAIAPFTTAAIQAPPSAFRSAVLAVTGDNDQ